MISILLIQFIYFLLSVQILADRGKKVTTEDLVLNALEKHGYVGPSDSCLLQSFELSSLERVKGKLI